MCLREAVDDADTEALSSSASRDKTQPTSLTAASHSNMYSSGSTDCHQTSERRMMRKPFFPGFLSTVQLPAPSVVGRPSGVVFRQSGCIFLHQVHHISASPLSQVIGGIFSKARRPNFVQCVTWGGRLLLSIPWFYGGKYYPTYARNATY